MPGPPRGAFVADDEDVVGIDLAGFDGDVAVVLVFEDAGGAGVVEALVAGDLDDAAVGGEVAAQDDEAAGGLERLVPGVDDGLAGGFDGERGFFVRGSCRRRWGCRVSWSALEQALRRGDASRRRPGSPWRRTCRRGRGRR